VDLSYSDMAWALTNKLHARKFDAGIRIGLARDQLPRTHLLAISLRVALAWILLEQDISWHVVIPHIIERVLCLYTCHWPYACQDDHPLQTSVSATGVLMTCSCSPTVIEAGLKLPVDVDDTWSGTCLHVSQSLSPVVLLIHHIPCLPLTCLLSFLCKTV